MIILLLNNLETIGQVLCLGSALGLYYLISAPRTKRKQYIKALNAIHTPTK